MKIILNGEPVSTKAVTLEQLCLEKGYGDAKIATAVNGGFVPQTMRNSTSLSDNDKVEIVSPRQGG